jgi:DNA invertase Pin-like site-specific DNA recombinase
VLQQQSLPDLIDVAGTLLNHARQFVTFLPSFRVHSNPHANNAMLQMLAVFAEHEREVISRRTQAALAQAKGHYLNLSKTISIVPGSGN